MCGPGDYTAMALVFHARLGRMLNWCSADRIFWFDYGTGPPSFTGARWVQIHALAPPDRNPASDTLSQMAYDSKRGRLYMFRSRTANAYTSRTWDPMLQWFDPFASPSCATHPPPCGRSGRFDQRRANFPQGYSAPRDPVSFAPDVKICWTVACQQLTASIAYDPVRDAVSIVGRRAGDAQIVLWTLTDPLGPNEAWNIADTFSFNTYDRQGLKLWTDGQSPADTANEFNLAGSTMSLLTYVPERDAFLLITRSGSGPGGASTRGSGTPKGGCYLDGVADDCFRMYGFRPATAPTRVGPRLARPRRRARIG
jgi:hypothetical protein